MTDTIIQLITALLLLLIVFGAFIMIAYEMGRTRELKKQIKEYENFKKMFERE